MTKRRKKYLYIFMLWVMVTFVLTSIPKFPGAAGISHIDKIVHFFIYGVSGFLYACYLREGSHPWEMVFICTFLLIALIAGADEFHQRWIPYRVPSLGDWMADVSGGATGSIVMLMADRLKLFGVTPNNE